MPRPDPKKSRARSRYISVIGLVAVTAAVWFGSETIRSRWLDALVTPVPTPQPTELAPSPTLEDTPTPTSTAAAPTVTVPTVAQDNSTPAVSSRLLVFAMSDGYFTHLFAYDPESLPLTRLTNDPWDDQYPVVSPDGTRIAFSSRRNGYWDIYVLDLDINALVRVTDTPQYDGAATWSPDGKWLAYETYLDGNFEIVLQSFADRSQPPIRLTNNAAADYSPVWSPGGRRIAYVSTTDGDEDIWIANLDKAENRLTNLTGGDDSADFFPSWSPDGRYLAWTSRNGSSDNITIQDMTEPGSVPRSIGSGRMPAWSADGAAIAAVLESPGQVSLVAYQTANQQMIIPPTNLPGSVFGWSWQSDSAAAKLSEHLITNGGPIPPILWENQATSTPSSDLDRYNLSMLEDVNVTYPFLRDNVAEPFTALREEIARQSGWDLLGDLENAFIPITTPPNPGGIDDWLFTGRAIALQKAPVQAGWMVIARENFTGDVYWRVWIRVRYQDGSQGQPIRARTWNLDARYSGDPYAYENGGEVLPAPQGYWLDVTELASRFGWKPLPALSNWRTFYPAARFNQFVYGESLDWNSAMTEIYPPEAVNEPTGIPTQPLVSLLTPSGEAAPSAESSPTSPGDATIRPTWTPPAGGE